MQIKIMVFGPLQDITGWQEQTLENILDSEILVEELENNFPELKNMEFRIALNRNLIEQKTLFQDQDEVALLPPFSGG